MALLNTGLRRPEIYSILTYGWACRFTGLARLCSSILVLLNILTVARGIVPAYLASQDAAITASAVRHDVPPAWLAAVLYNEMLGTEDQVLRAILPGEDPAPRTARSVILGIHFMSLKQLQWQVKSLAAMAGANPTLGPAGIRVTVGREIQAETLVSGGRYIPGGILERPSMVSDLSSPATAIEYLAANLERGQARLAWSDRGDWDASARWHNTGVVYDSVIVRPEDWEKGSRYIGRVRSCLPAVSALLRATDTVTDLDTARPPRMIRSQEPSRTALAPLVSGPP